MVRRFLISLGLTFLIAGFISLTLWINFLFTPLVSNPAGLRFQLHPGASLKTFSESLAEQGICEHPLLLTFLARLRGDTHELKAGIYLIPQGTTPGQLINQVSTGSGLLYHVFTIVPGWTFQQIRTALQLDSGLQHSIDSLSDEEVLKLLGSTERSTEGEFFPDSYYYVEGTSDLKLLNRAYKRMQQKSQEAWLKREAGLPFTTVYEALIAASLVEKEAHLSSERPVIAGVLVNRLQKKMLLQFDPTVIYGLNLWILNHKGLNLGFTGILRKQDLQRDTPYNSYLHKGLPPTPIAMPSLDALNAVLHPVQHGYLYFVATGSGGHQFSRTLYEHHLAVMMQHFHSQGFFNYLLIRNYLLKRFSNFSIPLTQENS